MISTKLAVALATAIAFGSIGLDASAADAKPMMMMKTIADMLVCKPGFHLHKHHYKKNGKWHWVWRCVPTHHKMHPMKMPMMGKPKAKTY